MDGAIAARPSRSRAGGGHRAAVVGPAPPRRGRGGRRGRPVAAPSTTRHRRRAATPEPTHRLKGWGVAVVSVAAAVGAVPLAISSVAADRSDDPLPTVNTFTAGAPGPLESGGAARAAAAPAPSRHPPGDPSTGGILEAPAGTPGAPPAPDPVRRAGPLVRFRSPPRSCGRASPPRPSTTTAPARPLAGTTTTAPKPKPTTTTPVAAATTTGPRTAPKPPPAPAKPPASSSGPSTPVRRLGRPAPRGRKDRGRRGQAASPAPSAACSEPGSSVPSASAPAYRSPCSSIRPSTAAAANTSSSGGVSPCAHAPTSSQVERGGHGRPPPPSAPQRVAGDRRLVRVVLAPVDEHLARAGGPSPSPR